MGGVHYGKIKRFSSDAVFALRRRNEKRRKIAWRLRIAEIVLSLWSFAGTQERCCSRRTVVATVKGRVQESKGLNTNEGEESTEKIISKKAHQRWRNSLFCCWCHKRLSKYSPGDSRDASWSVKEMRRECKSFRN